MNIWQKQTPLYKYKSEIDFETLSVLRAKKLDNILASQHWSNIAKKIEFFTAIDFNKIKDKHRVNSDYTKHSITVGAKNWLNEYEHEALKEVLRELIPWRKGPFNICGHYIDSEWRSNLKWDRIAPHLGYKNAKILDLGASNGYYMFRALELAPEIIVGLEPSERCFLSYMLVQIFKELEIGSITSSNTNDSVPPKSAMAFEMLKSDHLAIFSNFFDCALCMGVIYHTREPLTLLQQVKNSLKSGGLLILESQVINLPGPYALFPKQKYTKSHNMYFIPTPECLAAWTEKSGFTECKLISTEQVTISEQRKTDFAPYESLEEFLDPSDNNKTIEGYPAPYRAIVMAKKP